MKRTKLFISILLTITMLLATTLKVFAVVPDDDEWNSISNVVLVGVEYNQRFIDDPTGLTFSLNTEYGDPLPDGLTLNQDGTITGIATGNQEQKDYDIFINVTDEENNTTYNYYNLYVCNGGANLNNLFTPEAIVHYNGNYYDDNDYYTNQGFLVYSPTLADYVSYNAQTKTYNVTLTQDFNLEDEDDVGNYVELVFKDTEEDTALKYEIIENEGFKSLDSSYLKSVSYPYIYEGQELYSAYLWAGVDLTYTGNNRHLKVKVSNPQDSSQYRFIEFSIVDENGVYVAFNSNGGSSVLTVSSLIGEGITLPSEPTKEGWKFAGWYTDEELTTPFNPSQQITKNTILHAKWDLDYKFIEGANQKFILNKSTNATFRVNVNYDMFNSVFVDGEELDSSNYTVSSGSTIIVMNDDYMNSLEIGTHNLTVGFLDKNQVETTFEVTDKEEEKEEEEEKGEKDETPKTGVKDSNLVSYLAVIFTNIGLAITCFKR